MKKKEVKVFIDRLLTVLEGLQTIISETGNHVLDGIGKEIGKVFLKKIVLKGDIHVFVVCILQLVVDFERKIRCV